MERAQCIVLRGNKVLMVKLKLREDGHEFWCLPGGQIEENETPEEAVVRELKEECCLDGTIVGEICTITNLSEKNILVYDKLHTFLVNTGNQEPEIGIDPDHEEVGVLEVQWLTMAEIPERDRAFLWAAGLLGIEDFLKEVSSWGDEISYPGRDKN